MKKAPPSLCLAACPKWNLGLREQQGFGEVSDLRHRKSTELGRKAARANLRPEFGCVRTRANVAVNKAGKATCDESAVINASIHYDVPKRSQPPTDGARLIPCDAPRPFDFGSGERQHPALGAVIPGVDSRNHVNVIHSLLWTFM